ncbi:threonine/serine dehydratase [Denitrobaculum tricleocarpae]|uniref:Threonine/serine dehydratase n=1 Tax=Denitrobaculum tricleocarpae TaxID=2591009 RepID=A0A545TUR4_9PROT|nr:threonine/serine dehydratase [Denitrobaculum tricleocarpae]
MAPPVFADVQAAAERLSGQAIRTPLLENVQLNELCGGRVLIKAETLQRTGSFKFRGAFNLLSQIPEGQKAAGVVTCSSGNHAQGVASAAAILGLKAIVVMPEDAPRIKIENTKGYGAEVVFFDRNRESREEIVASISAGTQMTFAPPYDHPHTIAGQGTCGLEIAQQVRELGVSLDNMLVCCGGGGLTAGVALALSEKSPGTKVYTVEPSGFDDTARSLAARQRVSNEPGQSSICDAILTPTPGEITFEINRQLLTGGLSVTDSEVRNAMRFAFNTLKMVVEPGGAVTLAAVLSGRIDTKDRVTAITLSGGNVDPAVFSSVLKA